MKSRAWSTRPGKYTGIEEENDAQANGGRAREQRIDGTDAKWTTDKM